MEVAAEGFWGGEVQWGVVHGGDGAVGDEDVVDADVTGRVRHVQGVAQDRGVGGVGEGVEVPVRVGGQHDGCGLVEWDGNEAGCE